MKRLGAAAIALAAVVPVSSVLAQPDMISAPSVALQGAGRIGNATSTDTTAPPSTSAPAPTPNVSTEMQQILDLVNVERTTRGLVPVQFSSELIEAAQGHTERQADDGAIFHTDPRDGTSPGDRISRAGYVFSTWGENVAAGYETAAAVMDGWMNSPGHCKNILNPGFTELGVGYVPDGERYGEFWTQSFARPRSVESPAGTYDPAWC